MSNDLDRGAAARHTSRMRCLAWLACALSAGCSITIDDNDPGLPLVGSPPSVGSLRKYNNGPVLSSAIVSGRDGAYWLSLQEEKGKLRVVRLSEPEAEFEITGDQFAIRWRAFYTWVAGTPPTDSTMPTPAKLKVVSAGAVDRAVEFDKPLGIGSLFIGGADDVYAYSPSKGRSETYELVRLDGKPKRDIPLPNGPDSADLSGSFFNGNGQLFFDRGACTAGCDADSSDPEGIIRRNLRAHYTDRERDVDLGPQPSRFFLYEPQNAFATRRLFTCSSDGVRIVPLEPSDQNPPRVLDDAPCASNVFSLLRVTDPDGTQQIDLFYLIGHQLRRVRIDGSRAPQAVLDYDVERVLAVYGLDKVLYSQDKSDRYIYGVGDAWLGNWRFADRARLIYLTNDEKHVTYLENSAQSGGIGDLTWAPLEGASQRLVRNVYQYDELGDGRLLAASNHAFRGTQNRIVIVNEDRTEVRWVADQASQYGFIPGSSDLLVDIVTGASTSDLVRVPIPPSTAVDGGT